MRGFHWELEFPEVFGRDNPGFDAIVGNPPFVGGSKITGTLGTEYRDYLVERIANGKKGNADLCAYFFLRAGQLLRDGGMMALLATNTIAQGATREVGLDQMTAQGFSIPRAVASTPWPGEATLEVAQVWLYRGTWLGEFVLNEESVASITPFLTEPGQVAGKPYRLAANTGKSFTGSKIYGIGFLLAPEKAQNFIEKNVINKIVLFPYLNGEDLNSHYDQLASRLVINFHDWPLKRQGEGEWETGDDKQRKLWLYNGNVPSDYPDPVAEDFIDLLQIVEDHVKPERIKLGSESAKRKWWLYERSRPELYSKIAGMERVLVCSEVTKYLAFTYVTNKQVYSANLDVFALGSYGSFAILQSNIHTCWGREYSATLRTDLKYSPGNAFETFPFPRNLSGLDAIGERYYTHRQTIMQARREGLTATYNRFHNPNDRAPDIQQLRDLHVEMDCAVAAAYGWHDLLPSPPTPTLPHEGGGSGLGHGFHDTKQGLRFTVSEAARRELLDRLLALNHQRHEEEVAAERLGKESR